MNRSLKIAIADDDADMREFYTQALDLLGHEVTITASTGRELVDQCHLHRPDLIITDIKMPDMDGLEVARQLAVESASPIPIIFVSGFHDPDLIAEAEANHIQAYLVKPIKREDLEPAIALAVARFQQFHALRDEAADLRQALADRKIIERAKGIMMRQARLDEHDAFRRLQKLARDTNRKLIDIAQMVITTEAALRPND